MYLSIVIYDLLRREAYMQQIILCLDFITFLLEL